MRTLVSLERKSSGLSSGTSKPQRLSASTLCSALSGLLAIQTSKSSVARG